ncbi:MAG: hypothetical protein PV340_02155 [Wolbachia sp.]|nr:hypothetical protein [Wolbachia sp.]
MEKDEQSRASTPGNRSRRNSGESPDSGLSSDSKNEQTKKTEVVTYSTTWDGNCFFHAMFGERCNSVAYTAERVQEMRLE